MAASFIIGTLPRACDDHCDRRGRPHVAIAGPHHEYDCQLVVSDVVGTTAGVSLDVFPMREVQAYAVRH
jgi:hypothetical protein